MVGWSAVMGKLLLLAEAGCIGRGVSIISERVEGLSG
jgi:hypothetical protein